VNALPSSPRVTFRSLTPDDAPAVQALFDRCSDFYLLSEGAPAKPSYALEEITSRAPNKTADETCCWGLELGAEVVGFIHLTLNYPKPDEWWLGFLLLDPRVRREGLGAEAHAAMIAFAVANGAKVMWLGVLEQNAPARRFWTRMGYVERERQQWTAPTGLESTILLMSMPLESGA
jgi:RimJ/RimL family protein N-acetyltransferase